MNGKRSEDPRKKLALEKGRPIIYITCPLCGLNRVLHKIEKGRIRFGSFDLDKGYFVQVRYVHGGRGSGFWLNEEESLTLQQSLSHPEYRDLLLQIRDRCAELLEILRL